MKIGQFTSFPSVLVVVATKINVQPAAIIL